MEIFTVVSVYVQSVRGCSQSPRSSQEDRSVDHVVLKWVMC